MAELTEVDVEAVVRRARAETAMPSAAGPAGRA